jgi:hypothetical protein
MNVHCTDGAAIRADCSEFLLVPDPDQDAAFDLQLLSRIGGDLRFEIRLLQRAGIDCRTSSLAERA